MLAIKNSLKKMGRYNLLKIFIIIIAIIYLIIIIKNTIYFINICIVAKYNSNQ